MLSQEQDVEDHRKGPQAELGRIAENQLPLIWTKTGNSQTSIRQKVREDRQNLD